MLDVGNLINPKTGNKFIPVATQKLGNEEQGALKFADGTMICFGCSLKTVDITAPFENDYFSETGDVIFKERFINKPAITVTLYCNNALLGYNFNRASNEKFSLYVWKSTQRSNLSIWVNYVAIGRWK